MESSYNGDYFEMKISNGNGTPQFETEEVLLSEHTFTSKDLRALDEFLLRQKATGTLHVHYNMGGKTKVGFTQKQDVEIET